MICRDCGKEFFDEEHPRRRFCEDCRLEHQRTSFKKYYAKVLNDPVRHEQRKEQQRTKRKKDRREPERAARERERKRAKYVFCREKQLAYHRERWKRMTPDDKRRILLNKKIRKAVANDEHKPFCQWCGRNFEPKYKGEKYCSEECYSHSPLRRMYKENHKALKFLIDIFFKDGRLT